MAVSDAELTIAVDETVRDDGLLLCPEGGATLAACHKALKQGLVGASDRVVLFNCATGLKYPMRDRSLRLDRQAPVDRSEEHTSELQSLMRISYAGFCLKKKKQNSNRQKTHKRHKSKIKTNNTIT